MKPQKFKLIDDPVAHDLDYWENKIKELLIVGALTIDTAQKLCGYFETILIKTFYALYGSRTDMDGLAVCKFNQSPKKTTLEGEACWLQSDKLGHRFKIDIGNKEERLLYSYKFYDSAETMNQTIYIAKMPDSWVVD